MNYYISNYKDIELNYLSTVTNANLAEGIPYQELRQIVRDNITLTKDTILCGHNIKSDTALLANYDINFEGCELLCTNQMAQQILQRNSRTKLSDILAEAGIISVGIHNAYSDALYTALALSYLLKIHEVNYEICIDGK